MSYKANRGGHAPRRLREWFEQYIDAGRTIDADLREKMTAYIVRHKHQLRGKSLGAWLFGQLWDCEDIMPSGLRSDIGDLTDGEHFTYGRAVRALKRLG